MTDRAVRVQFDVTRPATIRLFAHTIEELARRGHETLVTARDAGDTTALLDDAGIDHQVVSSRRSSRLLAGPTKLLHEVRVAMAARSFVPDVVVSETNPAAVHAAHLLDAEALVFPVDEQRADRFTGLVQPFAGAVHTPAAFGVDFGAVQHRYDGTHAIGGLHPDRFRPDSERLRTAGVDPDEPFTVLGFRADSGARGSGEGFSRQAVRELCETVGTEGTVYAVGREDTAAVPLPVTPGDRPHALAFANQYVGDRPRLALRAGLLGTPSVQYEPSGADSGHLPAVASEYGLVVVDGDEGGAIRSVKTLASDPDAAERWDARSDRFVSGTVDTADYVLETVTAACRRTDASAAAGTAGP